MVTIKESVIPRLIKILHREITSTMNFNNKIIIDVSKGHFLCKDAKKKLYKFSLDSSIHPIDDIPIEIFVGTNKYTGHIVLTQDQEITIALNEHIGVYVANAKIVIKLTSVLEKLQAKIKESYDNKGYLEFHLANHFFEGKNDANSIPAIIPGLETLLKEYNQTANSTKSSDQRHKGQLRMLAHIIGSFMKTDMKILLVSNDNNFVDEATLCLAEYMKSSDFYDNGKIINMGAQEANEIFKDNELIVPTKIIKKLNKGLNNQKAAILNRMKNIDDSLMELSQGLALVQKRENNIKKISELSDGLSIIDRKIANIRKNIEQKEKQLEHLSNLRETQESSSFIDIILLKLGFNKSQNRYTKTKKELIQKQRELANSTDGYQKIEKQKKRLSDSLQNTYDNIFAFLEKFNLSEYKLTEKYEELISERDEIKLKVIEFDNQSKLIRSHILSNAMMIGSPLNMTFLSNDFAYLDFDLLVVDESSLDSEPQLYWALCKCKMAAIIVGDCLKFVVPSSSL